VKIQTAFILSSFMVMFPGFLGHALAADLEPETIIQISAMNLFKRAKPVVPPVLPADYGAKVASVIAAQKSRLLECLEGARDQSVILNVEIGIDKAGKGLATSTGSAALSVLESSCLVTSLSTLAYPAHLLDQNVVIRLPLSIRGEKL
jgi:hypothetical protein